MSGTGAGLGEGAESPDLFRTVQPLAAGPNIINHNLGQVPTVVQVFDNVSGQQHLCRVGNEGTTTVTIWCVVPIANARITIDC
jgi:hypothetical protein